MAEDDELDDTGSENEDNETDAGSGAPEYEPPSAEEWARTQAALKTANAEAKKHRLALKAARNNGGQPASGAPAGDVEAARAAARAEAAKEYEPKIIAAQARAALLAAGLAIPEGDEGKTVKRALRLLDTDSLSVGDDGSVDGLDAALEELRSEMPTLFRKGSGQRAGRVDSGKGGRSQGDGKPKSSAAKLAAGLRNS